MYSRRRHPYTRVPNRAAVRFQQREPGEDEDRFSFRNLSFWHYIAGGVHFVSFIALLVIYIFLGDETLRPSLFSDTYFFGDVPADTNVTCAVQNVVNKQLAGSGYDLALVLLPMPAVTALFHAIQGFATSRYDPADIYLKEIKQGVNWVRWLEYSITAALMTWIITQLSGVTNVFLVWMIAIVGNVSLQWHGYLHEVMFKDSTDAYQELRNWVPMLNGFVIFMGQWGVIACYFIRTVAANDSVPWFVWTSFFGLLFTFCTFPILQLIWVYRAAGGIGESVANFLHIRAWYGYEFGFIVLSLVSKLFLDWTLFIALITERSE